MKLSRSLGQVFLKDSKFIKRIIDHLDINDETVCEIGPGSGNMTRHLLDKALSVHCVEIDPSLCRILKEEFANFANITIVNQDILEFSLSQFKKKIILFGNVPYQISNKLMQYFVKNKGYIKRAYFTLQKEFAQKLIAKPSQKPYGFLSCYIQYHAKVSKIFDIPSRAFFPSPKVDSSFIELKPYTKSPFNVKDEGLLFSIIRKAFNQRRKKIINSMPLLRGRKDLLASLNIADYSRPENISLQQYVDLANTL